jgi:hypothetical protein
MLMQGTPKIHRTFEDNRYMVWVSIPVEYVERRLEGLINMPITVAMRDENRRLKFMAYSSVLSFENESDADLIASNLSKALSAEIDYMQIEPPPDEEYYYS